LLPHLAQTLWSSSLSAIAATVPREECARLCAGKLTRDAELTPLPEEIVALLG